MGVSLPDRVIVAPDVLFQKLDQESVLLDLKREIYYGLDDVGTSMWQLLVDLGEIPAVLQQLRIEYEVDEETLRADLAGLISQLAEEGLLAVEPPLYQEEDRAGA
ncbi:MAG: PqqD family protein [Chloroflexi bacterium]|nr:PqqD family protein [Chloroflexota bacterium]